MKVFEKISDAEKPKGWKRKLCAKCGFIMVAPAEKTNENMCDDCYAEFLKAKSI